MIKDENKEQSIHKKNTIESIIEIDKNNPDEVRAIDILRSFYNSELKNIKNRENGFRVEIIPERINKWDSKVYSKDSKIVAVKETLDIIFENSDFHIHSIEEYMSGCIEEGLFDFDMIKTFMSKFGERLRSLLDLERVFMHGHFYHYYKFSSSQVNELFDILKKQKNKEDSSWAGYHKVANLMFLLDHLNKMSNELLYSDIIKLIKETALGTKDNKDRIIRILERKELTEIIESLKE